MAGGRLRQLAGGLPWPVISIGVVTFLVLMGFGLMPPALPLYAAHYALSSAEVALLLTSFSTGMLVFSFPGGMIAASSASSAWRSQGASSPGWARSPRPPCRPSGP